MTKKMKAAVVEQFGIPLAFRELDIPSPRVGQILVKTEACGVALIAAVPPGATP